MNVEPNQKIISILKQHSPLEFADLDTHHLALVQENAFQLDHHDHAFFLKWVSREDERGLNEICANREFLSSADVPAPRLLSVIETEEGFLVSWEWLEGIDLREQHRAYLPAAFARLGRFHLEHCHNGEVLSPTMRRVFHSIPELLDAETRFLCSFYDPSVEAHCRGIFSLLEAGYPTFIHGDMHPGNIRLSQGALKFVDWGYAMPSLNLFDLAYVESIPLDREVQPWWIITPKEALDVLPAYFNNCGMEKYDYRAIHRAVMLWSELASLYNGIQNHFIPEASICRKNIGFLLEKPG